MGFRKQEVVVSLFLFLVLVLVQIQFVISATRPFLASFPKLLLPPSLTTPTETVLLSPVGIPDISPPGGCVPAGSFPFFRFLEAMVPSYVHIGSKLFKDDPTRAEEGTHQHETGGRVNGVWNAGCSAGRRSLFYRDQYR